MIISQMHRDKIRKILFFLKLLQPFDERRCAIEIAIIEIVGAIVGIKVTFEDRDFRPRWIPRIPSIGNELSE